MHIGKHQENMLSHEKFQFFWCPRSDACSTCEKYKFVEYANYENKSNKTKINLYQLQLNIKLHRLKTKTFYNLKGGAKIKSRKDEYTEGVAIDFRKKMSIPNRTTNDVYYKIYCHFIVSIFLSFLTSVCFYTYNETVYCMLHYILISV